MLIYGHRGARGLAPENTCIGFNVAIDLGVDFIDMDVLMSQDGEIVVTHDFCLNPDLTRDAKGLWITDSQLLVKNLTVSQLKKYNVGKIKPDTAYSRLFPEQRSAEFADIPTLREVIALVKNKGADHLGLQIELKTDPLHPENSPSPEEFAHALAEILLAENIVEHVEIQSFDYRCLALLQNLIPEISTAYLTHQSQDYNHSIPKMIRELGGKIWGPEDIQLTQEQFEEAKGLGLKVVPWSWPEKTGREYDEVMIRKLIKMGVDGIITDRPDLLALTVVLI